MSLRYATLGSAVRQRLDRRNPDAFAAPPVLMVAGPWGWDTPFMLEPLRFSRGHRNHRLHVGYALVFRREFGVLAALAAVPDEEMPAADAAQGRVAACAVVGDRRPSRVHGVVGREPSLPGVGDRGLPVLPRLHGRHRRLPKRGRHQDPVAGRASSSRASWCTAACRRGGLRPVLGKLSEEPMFWGATLLTAFNDNALITYLATLVPT